jgi:hypothetical protein
MSCEVCEMPSVKETCSSVCAALRIMAALQAQSDAAGLESYPGMLTDEREQLRWDFRRRWHEVRGLEFLELPPKTLAMRELERLDLMRTA